MQAIDDAGIFNEDEKRKINRFRCHQQVLFILDIMDAGGGSIDEKYLTRRPADAQWSLLVFPIEEPPRNHLALWSNAVRSVRRRLRRFVFKSFKVWEYRYNEEDRLIYHYKGNRMDIYSQALDPQYANRPNCFSTSSTNMQATEMGDICTIKRVTPTIIGVRSSSKPAPPADDPESFWDVIKQWGQTWLWDDITISGDLDWLAEAIRDNSLVAVTDGSYSMKEMYPHLNSAAFVFECSRGRGRLFGSSSNIPQTHVLTEGSYLA
jgi:hypothetical protein